MEAEPIYSPHAEESLVGSALIEPRLLDRIDVGPSAFWLRKLGMIWEALLSLRDRNMGIDFVTVGNELQARGTLAEVGGPAYLNRLILDTPSSMGAENYARIVKEYAARRRIERVAENMVAIARDKDSDLPECISRTMGELTESIYVNQGAVHWSQFISQAYDFVDERHNNPTGIWGIPTGYRDYDAMTGGLQPSELLLVAGQAGVGKSIFIMQMAQQLAGAGYPGALYSLEMHGRAIAIRGLSAASGIAARTLKTGAMQAEQWPLFAQAVEAQESIPLYLSDSDYWTTAGLRADLSRLKRQAGLQWFAVDYSYLIADGQGKLTETERTQIVVAALKGICKALDLSGIVIHSLNKLGELRGSGQVKYDADVVLSITMPDEMHPEVIRCTFDKGRELDEQFKHFELIRMNGIPLYKSAITKTTMLNPNMDWVK